jgi:glycosyltransferase involved in cell wall biosynthesis
MVSSSLALCHEWLTTYGGSEQVAQRIAQALGIHDIFVFASRPGLRNELFPNDDVKDVGGILASRASRSWSPFLPLMPFAWRRVDLSGYELVVTSSHACTNSIRPPQNAVLVSYCHTPMRYAWDWRSEIKRVPSLLRPIWPFAAARLRKGDLRRSKRVDLFIANSLFVAGRIRKYYGRGSIVMYPPIDTEYWSPGGTKGDYFLWVGRTVPYKKPEAVIEAANLAGSKLIVAGSGPMLDELMRLAGPTVTFEPSPSRDRLRDLYRSARALVFAGIEDFGMTMAEAQACGIPVIAYAAGGALEIVKDGCGTLVGDDSAESFAESMRSFQDDFDRAVIVQNAQRFDAARFDTQIRELIDHAVNRRWQEINRRPEWFPKEAG